MARTAQMRLVELMVLKEDISKVLGIDCEFIKILKEEEVKEDDSEENMGRVNNEQ